MTYSFGDFTLDKGRIELRRAGKACAVEPQVFDLLCYLLENRERVVSKCELFEVIWADRTVSDSALSSRIKAARQAIGDNGTSQSWIKTAHGKGFRFVGAVETAQVPRPVSGKGNENRATPPWKASWYRKFSTAPLPTMCKSHIQASARADR